MENKDNSSNPNGEIPLVANPSDIEPPLDYTQLLDRFSDLTLDSTNANPGAIANSNISYPDNLYNSSNPNGEIPLVANPSDIEPPLDYTQLLDGFSGLSLDSTNANPGTVDNSNISYPDNLMTDNLISPAPTNISVRNSFRDIYGLDVQNLTNSIPALVNSLGVNNPQYHVPITAPNQESIDFSVPNSFRNVYNSNEVDVQNLKNSIQALAISLEGVNNLFYHVPTTPPKEESTSSTKKRSTSRAVKFRFSLKTVSSCYNCRKKKTPQWRIDQKGDLVCNACGKHYSRRGEHKRRHSVPHTCRRNQNNK